MQAAWKSRRFTNLVRYLLDDWMPPVLREWRPLARVLARTFHGQHFDIDFKLKAFHLTEGEFAAAYSRLQGGHTEPYRLTDMTPGQLDWLTAHALGPNVLEVGCGFGVLAERLAGRGDLQVTATDLSDKNVEMVRHRLGHLGDALQLREANLECLPFADRSFDSTLCAHTLEHVRQFGSRWPSCAGSRAAGC